MMMIPVNSPDAAPHVPVLIEPLVSAVAPVSGVWLDGTFGAGGYARALLGAGAERVIGVDRDPTVFALAAGWAERYGARLDLRPGRLAGSTSSQRRRVSRRWTE